MSWAPDLSHNLLSTIFLALKKVKILLRKASVLIQICHNNKIHKLADIINQQYVLRIKPPKAITHFANTISIINAVKSTFKLWHQRMGHLGYQNILKLL